MEDLCILCNNLLKFKSIKNVKKYDIMYDVYLCESCRVGSTIPKPSPDDLSKLYSAGTYRLDSGKRFNPFAECLIYVFRFLRKKRIQKYIDKGRILDIGCGRGLFLEIMRKDGWNVTGVEFDAETASYASKAYNIRAIPAQSVIDLPDESFDVITLIHSLEHTPDPAGLINQCKRLLKKKGLIVVAVPNFFSFQASVGKKVWFHLDLPYHLHHFSEEGLSTLLNKYSFKILNIRRFDVEYSPFGWLQTLLNLSGVRENLLFNLIKSPGLRRKEISSLPKGELILNFFLLPIYLPASVLLSVFESFLLKKGGTIEIYASKE